MILKGVRYVRAGAQPVLIKPGILANTYMFKEFGSELHETLDVWMINARAHGKGQHRSTKAPPQYQPGGDLYAGHGFDAMILEDMDPVLARIREVTGFPKVALIGHSMGGMVEKAYLRGASGRAGIVRGFDPELARQRSEQVLQLFTIGSPWHFRDMPAYLEFLTHALRLIPDSPEFMLPTVGPEQAPTIADPEGLRARLSAAAWKPIDRIGMPLLFPPGIVDVSQLSKKEVRRLREKAVSRITGDLVHDFRRWIKSGRFESRGGLNYEQAIPLGVPWFSYASPEDVLARLVDLIEEGRILGNTVVEVPGMAHVNLVYGVKSRIVARDVREKIETASGLTGGQEAPRYQRLGPGCKTRLRDRFWAEIRK